MTRPPTVDQLRNLADRADRGALQPAEVALLRAAIDELAALRALAEPAPATPATTGAAEAEDLAGAYTPDPPIGCLTPAVAPDDTNAAKGALKQRAHQYLSTGCWHGDHAYCQSMTGLNGSKRPGECKFCHAPCECPCHQTGGSAAHNDGPTVAECRAADRRWPLQKAGE
ncbi:hypothetical protein [Streptomyces scabiei]|uniref:hypothetical protein n=1 Tax=Streptomyces scabiei TaxID=1930 RepID=UPI000765E4DD|nr:hypothetical protein [Streptomyces scabiei]